MRKHFFLATLLVISLSTSGVHGSSGTSSALSRCQDTVVGTCFLVQSSLLPEIQRKIVELRAQARTEREQGRLVAYLSTPMGDYGVGYTPLNIEIANFLAARHEAAYQGQVWVLNPAAVQLPREARGADYMYLWTQVLAGEDGLGQGFDLAIMTGPTDVAAFFADAGKHASANAVDAVDRWTEHRAATDSAFRTTIAENPERRRRFRAYYAFGASTAFSAGAHDEWNLFRLVNEKRRRRDGNPAGQLPIYFDGRLLSPAEMETPVSPGSACPGPG